MTIVDTTRNTTNELSPFPAGSLASFEAPAAATEPSAFVASSPFRASEAWPSPDRYASDAVGELLADLADEDFDETLHEIVGHAAALEARADELGGAMPGAAAWLDRLAALGERSIDGLGEQLGSLELDRVDTAELEAMLERFDAVPGSSLSELEEQFLGGLVRKAKAAVRGAARLARKGVALASRFMPVNIILGKLRALVRPLLQRVLRFALGKLPAAARPYAQRLAEKLGISTGAAASPAAAAPAAPAAAATDTATPVPAPGDAAADGSTGQPATELEPAEPPGEAFDLELAGLLFAQDPYEAEQIVDEALAEAEHDEATADASGALDVARRQLAGDLVSMPSGSDPTASIQQFVPAVMAVMPIARVAVRMIGRQRVVNALASMVAPLVAGQIGSDAAQRIARPLADVGLRQLGLEVPAEREADIAGEALSSIVEEAVSTALSLPAEVLADELHLAATVQRSFAEAVSRHLPSALVRHDLPEREVDGAPGVWVLMPRRAPRYRYKQYSHVYAMPISRQIAAAVPWSDGGTLQAHLEDEGATEWPVHAEIHLYETLPGTHPGALGAGETGEAGDRAGSHEIQPLTEATAGLLLREPRLGRNSAAAAASAGRARYFRVVVPGRRRRRAGRPRRRASLRLVLGSAPTLRVAFRLSEREGQELSGRLERRDLAGTLAWFNERTARLQPRVAAVLTRGTARTTTLPFTADRAPALASAIVAALASATSAELSRAPSRLAPAVQDPAQGLTVVFTVALGASTPAATTDVVPGWVRP